MSLRAAIGKKYRATVTFARRGFLRGPRSHGDGLAIVPAVSVAASPGTFADHVLAGRKARTEFPAY